MIKKTLFYFRYTTFLSITLLFSCFAHSGNTVYLDSCSFEEVSNAVTVAPHGNVIYMGDGVCDWGSNSLTVDKRMYIKGRGKGLTKIVRSVSTSEPLIEFDCRHGLPVKLADISFFGLDDPSESDVGVHLSHGCSDFQIFRSSFSGFANAGIIVSDYSDSNPGQLKGIIYRNDFFNNYKNSHGYGISIYNDGDVVPAQFGTEEAVYIEDNLFVGNKHSVSSNRNAFYVFRHNTVANNHIKYQAIDTHGITEVGKNGTLAFEIYKNQIYQAIGEGAGSTPELPDEKGKAGIGIRGGSGVIFSNNIVNQRNPIYLFVDPLDCENQEYPVAGQATEIYIWDNHPNEVSVHPGCGHLYLSSRDYFLVAKPSYVPYTYPHPKRLVQ